MVENGTEGLYMALSRPLEHAARARCMTANRSTAMVVRGVVDERSQIDSERPLRSLSKLLESVDSQRVVHSLDSQVTRPVEPGLQVRF
jgi:hypothetical protein